MTLLSRQRAVTTIALVALFAPIEVMACGVELKRTQITIFGQLEARIGSLPQESVLMVGDLISVLAPRHTRAQVVTSDDQPSSALVSIAPDRYKVLSKEGGGAIPPEIQMPIGKLEWLHFGAASTGIAYVRLASGSERGLVRVEINDRPAAVQATNLIWTDKRQSEPISLSSLDTLTLDLPGEPGSGWSVRMRRGKAILKFVSEAESATELMKPRIHMQVQAYSEEIEDELVVTRSGAESYRFKILPKAIPKC